MVMPFQYPGNAMVNFQPLDSALKDYQTGMQVAGESTAKINAANMMKAGDMQGAAAELAKVDPRTAMEYQLQPGKLESQKMANEETTRKLVGGTMEALAAIPDPALRTQAAQKIFATDPRWAAGAAKFGLDVNNPAHTDAIIAAGREEALGAQAPEQKALTVARTGQANREKLETDQSLYDFGQKGQPQGQPGATPQPVIQGGTTLKTQEQREAAAARLGLKPGSMEYNDLIANGRLREVVPDHKAIQAADESTRAADTLINNIGDALQLSKGASTGLMGSTAQLQNRVYGGTEGTRNAETFNNIVQTAILPQMRQLFGGRVTNVDVLLMKDLAGAAGQPPEVREEVLRRAVARAQQLREEKYQEAQQMRQGVYYKPGGGASGPEVRQNPNVPQSGPATGPTVQKQFTDRMPAPGGAQGQIPPDAVRFLQAHPETAGAFQAKYNVDPSQFLQQR